MHNFEWKNLLNMYVDLPEMSTLSLLETTRIESTTDTVRLNHNSNKEVLFGLEKYKNNFIAFQCLAGLGFDFISFH